MTTEQTLVQAWLNTARWAASGGNAQPWRVEFQTEQNQIILILSIDPTYVPKHSPLDVLGTAAVFALGALAINLQILAAEDNYQLHDQRFDEYLSFWNCRLILKFKYNPQINKWHLNGKDILNRQTNRMPFGTLGIGQVVIDRIRSCAAKYPQVRLTEIQSLQKKDFVKTLLPLENIRWQSETYLNSLFAEISFAADIETVQDKIPISQLGLNSMDQKFFKVLSESTFLKSLFQKLLYPAVTKKALMPFSQYCDRLFVVQAHSFCFRDCVALGSFFQEVWMEINKMGVAFQPWGTPLVALANYHSEPLVTFSERQKQDLQSVAETVKNNYAINLQQPVMIFRTGWPKAHHARAPRKKLIGDLVNQIKDLVS